MYNYVHKHTYPMYEIVLPIKYLFTTKLNDRIGIDNQHNVTPMFFFQDFSFHTMRGWL